jgi:hypothetical protein
MSLFSRSLLEKYISVESSLLSFENSRVIREKLLSSSYCATCDEICCDEFHDSVQGISLGCICEIE